MPVKIVWDNPEETRLRFDIAGDWTWDQLFEAQKQSSGLMEQSSANIVGAIIYFTEGKIKIPSDTLQKVRSINFESHPKAGLTVIVGANMFMRTAFATMKNVYSMTGRSVEFDYANSLEKARQMIDKAIK